MTVVACHYCGCPVEFDPNGNLEEMGITLADCNNRNLVVICNLCTDMTELEEGTAVEVIEADQIRKFFGKDAA